MKRVLVLCAVIRPFAGLAESLDRPIPQAQSAKAEFWFTLASLVLIVALVAVGQLVANW